MGYMKEKYTTAYYLKKDEHGQDTIYGVEGLSEFKKGDIRSSDKDILNRIEFADKKVLDIGFGRGEALKFAADHGAAKLVGVDFSESAYEIATNFLSSYGIKAELYCEEAIEFLTSYTLDRDKNSFDIVIMLDCVEHIPRGELSQILNLISRCLSPRGVIAINTPVFKVDNDVIAEGLNPQARDTSDDFEETEGMHCNRYTKKSLKSYMRNSNFKAISGHFFVPHLPILRFLEGSKQAWIKAYNIGYPISLSAVNYSENFEYAMSWEDIRMLEKRNVKNIMIKTKNAIKKKLHFFKNIVKKVLIKLSFLPVNNQFENNNSWLEVVDGPVKGYQMFLDLNSPTYWHGAMIKGKYDSFIYDALRPYQTMGATVWDLGAHIGYHSLAFAALVGETGKVVAFEPNPHNFQRLSQNIEKNSDISKRITLMTCALSNFDGQSEFFFSSEVDNGKSSGSHLEEAIVPEEKSAYDGFKKELVQTAKADTLLKQNFASMPSIIKIDVEGAESLVLEGAVELLSKYKPLLLIEVHNITQMFYVQKRLLKIGYNLEILDKEHTSLSRCFIIASHPEKYGI